MNRIPEKSFPHQGKAPLGDMENSLRRASTINRSPQKFRALASS